MTDFVTWKPITTTLAGGFTQTTVPFLIPTKMIWPKGWLTLEQYRRKQLAKELGEMSSRKGYG